MSGFVDVLASLTLAAYFALATGSPAIAEAPASPAPIAAPNPDDLDAGHFHEGVPDYAGELEITVIERAEAPSRGASDFNLRVGALRQVPRQNAAELLKLAPGILLTNEGGDGHPQQIYLRGFDAREGQDIELTVDGVPINEPGNLHGNGLSDTNFIIPELVHRLRVLEGPYDPRQGNFAVAGSADFELGLEDRGITTKFTTGSFSTYRLLGLWGPDGERRGTFAGVELFSTGGFGKNRAAKRGSVIGQYEGELGTSGLFRLMLQGYTNHYNSAGVIRADDFEAGSIGFYDTYDSRQGGTSTRLSAAADIEGKVGNTRLRQLTFFTFRDMRMQKNYTGYLLDVQTPRQTPHAQRGDLIDLAFNAISIGGRGSANLSAPLFGQKQELELGYYARYDITSGDQLRLQANNGVPYARDLDVAANLGNIAAYLDAGFRPLSWLQLRGGVRGDIFTFNVLDRCAAKDVSDPSRSNPPGDASCLTQQQFGRYRDAAQRTSTASFAINPRGTLIFGPFYDLSASLSAGQGTRSIDPIYVIENTATPFASATSIDAGIVYARTIDNTNIVAKAGYFRTWVDRELIFSQSAGRNTLSGGTVRDGAVGSLRATGRFFDQSASITGVHARFTDDGLLIPYVPEIVVRSDSSFFHDFPGELLGKPVRGALALGITYISPRPLPFGQRGEHVVTLDANASVAWRWVELGFTVTNLLDQQYRLSEFNYVSDFQSRDAPTLVPARHFSAGSPRAFFVSLIFRFGETV